MYFWVKCVSSLSFILISLSFKQPQAKFQSWQLNKNYCEIHNQVYRLIVSIVDDNLSSKIVISCTSSLEIVLLTMVLFSTVIWSTSPLWVQDNHGWSQTSPTMSLEPYNMIKLWYWWPRYYKLLTLYKLFTFTTVTDIYKVHCLQVGDIVSIWKHFVPIIRQGVSHIKALSEIWESTFFFFLLVWD